MPTDWNIIFIMVVETRFITNFVYLNNFYKL